MCAKSLVKRLKNDYVMSIYLPIRFVNNNFAIYNQKDL